MRIGIFSESFEPVVNGVSVSIGVLRSELERRGHEVFCFAPSAGDTADEEKRVIRLPSIRPPSMRDYPVALPPLPSAFRRFKELRLDIVHTHTPFVLGLAGLVWARRSGIPVVSTNHTLYASYVHYVRWMPRAVTRAIAVRWMRWYYGRCRMLIVPSAAAGAVLEDYGVRTPWRAIPTGIELPEADDRGILGSLGIGSEERLLIYVGRVAVEKNLDMLFAAFRQVAEKHPDVRLLVVGGGPKLEDYRREIAGGALRDRVLFTGSVRRPQIPALLGRSDLFVFPSKTETQGLAIGEAALCGVPCVAVGAGGVPDFVNDGVTGFLVQSDPDEFAMRVNELLEDRDRLLEMGARAREMARSFTTAEMTERILEVYEMAMGPV